MNCKFMPEMKKQIKLNSKRKFSEITGQNESFFYYTHIEGGNRARNYG